MSIYEILLAQNNDNQDEDIDRKFLRKPNLNEITRFPPPIKLTTTIKSAKNNDNLLLF
jgi:hypothetical protein